MNFQDQLYETLIHRASTRAFLSEPVKQDVIDRIIQSAMRAPSAKNTQPWRLVQIGKETMNQITSKLIDEFDAKNPPRPDMEIAVYEGIFRKSAIDLGKKFYEHLRIDRKNNEQKIELVYNNYRFWNAPHAFYLYSLSGIKENEIYDIGIFSGFLFALMEAFGIGYIAQASLVNYPDLVKEILDLDPKNRLITGISFGYPDNQDEINSFSTDRFDVDVILKRMN